MEARELTTNSKVRLLDSFVRLRAKQGCHSKKKTSKQK
jgi:hypothetical protein